MSQFLPNPAIKDTPFGALEAADYGNYFPIGMIISWTGTYGQVPNGWLICHGQDLRGYETDLPRLHQMIPDYHSVGFFHTPDFRGRSPIGTTTLFEGPIAPIDLGVRKGDWKTARHGHEIIKHSGDGSRVGASGGTGTFGVTVTPNTGSPDYPLFATSVADENHHADGLDHNFQPVTGVNFLIYCGQDTSAIKDRDDLGNVSAVTARMMIESRLAEAGVDPEEVKMLKEQLEALKTAEAS